MVAASTNLSIYVMVGGKVGVGATGEAKKLTYVILAECFVLSLVMALICAIWPTWVASLFTDQAEVVTYTA